MASDVRQQYIKGCEEAYKKLLGLESFPEYNIKYKTITMENPNNKDLIHSQLPTMIFHRASTFWKYGKTYIHWVIQEHM